MSDQAINVIRLESDPRMIELLEQINKKLDCIIGGDQERVYSLKEAALRLGISYNTALGYAKSGELRYVDKGAGKQKVSYSIPQSAIDDFQSARMKNE